MDKRIRWAGIALAAVHTLMLAAYTMPTSVVPERSRYWAQAYARVLFHQDWRLFAPDPPACGCSIEMTPGPVGRSERLEDLHHGFIWKRMAANACRYAEASYDEERGAIIAPEVLQRSLLDMTGRDPRVDGSTFFVQRSCRGSTMDRWEIRFSQALR